MIFFSKVSPFLLSVIAVFLLYIKEIAILNQVNANWISPVYWGILVVDGLLLLYFILRFSFSKKKHYYLTSQQGWLDFITPLTSLALVSVPFAAQFQYPQISVYSDTVAPYFYYAALLKLYQFGSSATVFCSPLSEIILRRVKTTIVLSIYAVLGLSNLFEHLALIGPVSPQILALCLYSLIVISVFLLPIVLIPALEVHLFEPISVMQKGFDKKEFILMVRIPKNYQHEEIFSLASSYNKRWIPAKLRKLEKETEKAPILTLSDFTKEL